MVERANERSLVGEFANSEVELAISSHLLFVSLYQWNYGLNPLL